MGVVQYDFDGRGVLQMVTIGWVRKSGAAQSAMFNERAAYLARKMGLPPPQRGSALRGDLPGARIALLDDAAHGMVVEHYAAPR